MTTTQHITRAARKASEFRSLYRLLRGSNDFATSIQRAVELIRYTY